MLRALLALAAASALAVALPVSAHAQADTALAIGDFGPSPLLPPDPEPVAAVRSRFASLAAALEQRGVTGTTSLTGLWIGDLAGGLGRGSVGNTLGTVSLDADLGSLVRWRGGHAVVSGAWIQGPSASELLVGDALVVSNIAGYRGVRLYEAWLEQQFAGGHAGLRVGSMDAGSEFTVTDGGSLLVNGAFGWEAGIGGNVVNGGPVYFSPALGARLLLRANDAWSLRVGAYDGDTFDSPEGDASVNASGTHFELDAKEGAFLVAEGRRQWAGAHAARVQLGAWHRTADVADGASDASESPAAPAGLAPELLRGLSGAYGSLELALWPAARTSRRALDGWLRIAGAPRATAVYTWVGDAGLRLCGPWRARPDDAIALGIVTAHVSPVRAARVRALNAADGAERPVPVFERVVEATYVARINERWSVAPDVQWVQRPGTFGDVPNAWVAGLRLMRQ